MELRAAQAEVEAISQVYARRFGVERTDDWFFLKLTEEVGELTQAYLARGGRSRSPGSDEEFRDELADVLTHVMLIAERFGVDLAEALAGKWFRWRHLLDEEQA